MNRYARLRFRLIWLLTWLAVVSAPAFAQTGPVGYWKFDEASGTAPQDSSGNANHCTMSPAPTWTTGRVNGGLSFDGVDDTVNCGSGTTLGTLSQMTVSAWVNLATVGEGNFGRIVQKGNGGNPTAGWRLVSEGTRQIEFTVDYSGGDMGRVTATNAFTFGNWAHVAATWSGSATGSTVHIYINGVEASYSGTPDDGVGTRNSDNAAPLRIGNTDTGASTVNGKIDEVRVYNRVLTLAEIQALADSTPPSAPTSLAATVPSSSQINLSWTAATDNIAVTGYLLERCAGAGCISWTQIATPATTTYNDTGLSASTLYRYRVLATDANTNVSTTYSNIVDATTNASGGGGGGGSGPVGYWKFDEATGTAPQDSSGNANHCTMSPAPAWTAGKINGALNFDGVDDIVNCGSGATLGTLSQMTVSAWVNLTSVGEGNFGRIVQKGNGGNPTAGWRLVSEGTRQIEFTVDYSSGDLGRVTATSAFPFTTWTHVAATWGGTATGSTVHIYINGVEASYSGTPDDGVGTRNSDTAAPLRIGNTDLGGSTVNGKIDEVRVYNRVLTLAEIQAIADGTVPSTPSALGVSAPSSSQINLSWTGSTDNIAVTAYSVERCSGVGCVSYASVASPLATTYSDTGLTASTSYSYRIAAKDAAGNTSLYSNIGTISTPASGPPVPATFTYVYDDAGRLKTVGYEDGSSTLYTLDAAGNRKTVETTPPPDHTVPGAPGVPTFSLITLISATATWTAATDNVAVVGYEYTIDGGAHWIAVGNVLTTNVTGLTPSTLYTFQVRALDAFPNAGPASSAPVTTLADTSPPGPPGAPTFSAVTNSTATMTWTAATDNVGVVGYEYSLNAGTTWQPVGLVLTTNLTGLTPGTTYPVRVRAKDQAGNPGATSSGTLSMLSDTTPPGPPGSPAFSSVTLNSAIMNWTAASDNVGVTGYDYSLNGGVTWQSLGNVLTTTLTSLAPATSYSVKVRARDLAGNIGAASSNTLTTLSDTTGPSAPGVPVFSSITLFAANMTWSVATDNVGVTGYEYSLNAGASWQSLGNVLTTNLAGLTPGTTYPVRIRAKDAAGNPGTASSGSLTTLSDTTVPGAPGTPTFSSITPTSGIATWTPATDNVGVIGYEYRVNGGAWQSIGNVLSVSVTALMPFVAYTVDVRAKDAAGNSGAASSNSFQTTDGYIQITDSAGNVLASSTSLYSIEAFCSPAFGGQVCFWRLKKAYGALDLVSEIHQGISGCPMNSAAAGTYTAGYVRASGNTCEVAALGSVYGH